MNENRYREAEQRLFDDAGIAPSEHWLELGTIGSRARVLEIGDGTPLVFLHGGPMSAATWSYVVSQLTGMRAILVDRPGCGLSEPPPHTPTSTTLPDYLETLTGDVLDALALDRATIVGSSLGGSAALRSAAALPHRVRGVFLAGCPPFVPGWTQIPFFTLLRTPVLGWAMVRLPATRASVRVGLRQMGHSKALRQDAIPGAMLDWERAWQRDTDTLRNDASMIRQCGTRRGGFDPSLDLAPADLGRVRVPVHLLVGSDDPIGATEVGGQLTSVLPQGTLEVWEGAGHLPWLEDPARFAHSLQTFSSVTRAMS